VCGNDAVERADLRYVATLLSFPRLSEILGQENAILRGRLDAGIREQARECVTRPAQPIRELSNAALGQDAAASLHASAALTVGGNAFGREGTG